MSYAGPRRKNSLRFCAVPLVDTSDLVTVADITERIGVKRQTIHAWLRRHASFPSPVTTVGLGNIHLWEWPAVRTWVREHRPELVINEPTT